MRNLPIPAALKPQPAVDTSMASFTLMLMVGLLFFSFVADLAPSVFFSVAALVVFLAYVIRLARNAPYTFALLSGYLFLRFTMFISGIAIGTGAYMPEVQQFGQPGGGYLRLAIVYMLIISVILKLVEPRAPALMEHAGNVQKRVAWGDIERHWWVFAFFGVVGLMLLYLVFFGLQNGFAFLQGTSRMAYRLQYGEGSYLNTILNNRGIIVGLLGLIYAYCSGFRKKASLALLVVFGAINILFGEKFTSLVSMMVDFFIPLMIRQAHTYPWRRVKNLVPLACLTALIMCVTIPVMMTVYSGDEGLDAGLTKFYERVSSQAQLWDLVDRDTSDAFRFDEAALTQDWRSFWSSDPNSSMVFPYAGLYNVMAVYAPTDLLSASMDLQLGYTMAFEAYILKTFGWLGSILPFVLVAGFQGLLVIYWLWAIGTKDPISLVLALKLQVWAKGTFNDGNLYYMFGYRMWLFLILVVAYEVITKSAKNQLSQLPLKHVR